MTAASLKHGPEIAIVDYGAGNLTSVKLAFQSLGEDSFITGDSSVILAARRVVFPGVGAIGSAMKRLTSLNLLATLKAVAERGVPFLGICLGMQVLFEHSEEDGGVDGLGVLPGRVKSFRQSGVIEKVPQIGWNSISIAKPHPALEGIESGSEFYFVHSYYPAPSHRADVLCETEYAGIKFASAVARDNLIATQFHPERSGRIGLKLLENFCQLPPAH